MKRLINRAGLLSLMVLTVLLLTFGTASSADEAEKVPSQGTPGAVQRSFDPKAMPEPARLPDIRIVDEKGRTFKGAAGVKFLLKDIVFQGNRVISSEDLKALVGKYLGQKIEVDALPKIADSVTKLYKGRGYFLSRAFLPPQTIKDSVLIKIREGHLGEIIIKGNKRYSRKLIRNTLKIIRGEGAVRLADVERGLMLLMDYPGLDVKATFKPGERPGTTDLVLNVKEDRIVAFGFDYNNFGSKFVSQDRAGAYLSFNNLAKQGESLTFKATTGIVETGTEGLFYSNVSLVVPVNYLGTRFGISYHSMQYKLSGDLDVLDAGGRSYGPSIWFSHPFIRTRKVNFFMELGLDVKDVQQSIFDEVVAEDRIRQAWLGFRLQTVDRALGGGHTVLSVKGYQGLSSIMGGQPEEYDDTVRLGSKAVYSILAYSLTRYQSLPFGTVLLLSMSGQYTNARLPSSEQLHLGGANTVRGYAQGEYSGDEGYYGTIEYRIPLINRSKVSLQFAGFYDYGRVLIKDPLAGEEDISGFELSSLGAGLRFSYSPYMQFKLDWAKSSGGKRPFDDKMKDEGVWYAQFNLSF